MDRGVFFLGAAALGAAVGFVAGKSCDDDAGITRTIGIWKSRKGAGTAAGAIIGASVAGLYFYVELLCNVAIWCGKACANYPVRTGVIALIFLVVVGICAQDAQNNQRRPSPGRRV